MKAVVLILRTHWHLVPESCRLTRNATTVSCGSEHFYFLPGKTGSRLNAHTL
jgi:hypothetical protein